MCASTDTLLAKVHLTATICLVKCMCSTCIVKALIICIKTTKHEFKQDNTLPTFPHHFLSTSASQQIRTQQVFQQCGSQKMTMLFASTVVSKCRFWLYEFISLFALLSLDLSGVEFKLFALQNVTITTTTLARTRGNAGYKQTDTQSCAKREFRLECNSF